MSRRALRSASAWALPRPSAIASAKLAKSTVNQSQSEIARMKPAGASPWPEQRLDEEDRREHAADQHDEHDRVLAPGGAGRASRTTPRCAPRTIVGSKSGTGFGCVSASSVLDQRSRASGARRSGRARAPGMNVSAPTMITTPIEQHDEQRRVRRAACPGSAGTLFFCASEPAIASVGIGEPEAREEHRDAAESRCRRACWRRGRRRRCRCCSPSS